MNSRSFSSERKRRNLLWRSALFQSSTAPEIKGLLPQHKFDRLSSLHETVSELRKQIPSLLSVPLTEQEAVKTYTADTRLTVRSEASVELASDLKELLGISNLFVLALAASARAGAFLSSFGQQNKQQKDPSVDCQIAFLLDSSNVCSKRGALALADDAPTKIEVTWEANLPQQLLSEATSKIKGVSLLILDPATSKVTLHQLVSVYWNGAFLDSVAIGQSLAALRQTVKGLQDSPLVQTFLSSSSPQASSALAIFNQLRDEFIQQQLLSATSAQAETTHLAPLYVAITNKTATVQRDVTATTTDDDGKATWIPIDAYNDQSTRFPLPGSTAWEAYAACHRTAVYFVNTVIPALSDGRSESAIITANLFQPGTRIITLDGSVLLQGASTVLNFFTSIATLRRRTLGSWTLLSANITEWKTTTTNIPGSGEQLSCTIKVTIDYSTSLNIPGAAPTTVRGTDVYVVSSASPFLIGSVVEPIVVVEEIQQKRLSIGENSNPNDGVFFLRSLATTIESSGRLPSASGFWLDLLQGATVESRRINGSKQQSVQQQPKKFPSRSDKAALTSYRVMQALHQDCANFVVSIDGSDSANRATGPPGNLYMVENVQLNGYLGEVLLRGRSSYNQIFTLAMASFQATLRSGRVVSEREPNVRVELTPKGNVLCSLTLYLKLSPPLLTGIPVLDFGMPAASIVAGGGSFLPLKIGLMSEYVLCSESGKIIEHRLLESRVNGQLTPGDVVSRWVQRLSGGAKESDDDGNAVDWLRTLQDIVEWARSRNSNAQ